MSNKKGEKVKKLTMAPKTRARTPSVGKKGASGSGSPKEPAAKGPERSSAAASDRRLPAVGTVIQKRDRHGHVRCECSVEQGGIRYGGVLYRSISSAALAAGRDLGLLNKSQNGYVFWNLVKVHRPGSDPVAALGRSWERYRSCAEALLKDPGSEENREKGRANIGKHAAELAKLEESGEVPVD